MQHCKARERSPRLHSLLACHQFCAIIYIALHCIALHFISLFAITLCTSALLQGRQEQMYVNYVSHNLVCSAVQIIFCIETGVSFQHNILQPQAGVNSYAFLQCIIFYAFLQSVSCFSLVCDGLGPLMYTHKHSFQFKSDQYFFWWQFCIKL